MFNEIEQVEKASIAEEEMEEENVEETNKGKAREMTEQKLDENAPLLINSSSREYQDTLVSFGTQDSTNYLTQSRKEYLIKNPDDVNIFSFATFSFVKDLLNLKGAKGRRDSIELDDIHRLANRDTTAALSRRFAYEWDIEKNNNPPMLRKVFRKMFGRDLLVSGFIRLIYDVLLFVPPLSLGKAIDFCTSTEAEASESLASVGNPDERTYDNPLWVGIVISAIVLFSGVLGAVFEQLYLYYTTRIGQNMRTSLLSAVYSKCFSLSQKSRHNFPPGHIINFMSVDSSSMVDVMPNIHLLWSAPLEIIVSIVFLIIDIGWSGLVGVVIFIIAIPINIFCVRKMQSFKVIMMREKDTRVKLMNEVLNSIKTIKLMVWEPHLHGQLSAARHREVAALLKVIIWRSMMQFITWILPMCVSLGTFAVYVWTSGPTLTVKMAFVANALYNVMRFPLMKLPRVFGDLAQGAISLRRITAFLKCDTIDTQNTSFVANSDVDGDSIVMKDANYIWEDKDIPALENITMNVKKNATVAIIGEVASGKSALIRAILGFLKRSSGDCTVCGKVAFASQHAWVQNMTLRDNILFGLPYEKEKYDRIVDACELRRDIEILSGGDMAELGEEGSNLSGGQKQRLNLARAVYQDPDVIFLDDTLSAVDANVGENIFTNCIQGLLKDKTVIFATQSYQYLSRVDYIFVMKDGKIVEQGTYADLAKSTGTEFERLNSNFVAQLSHNNESTENESREMKRKAEMKDIQRQARLEQLRERMMPKKKKQALISAEDKESGSVPLKVYTLYIKEAAIVMVVITLVCFFASTFCNMSSFYWIALWTQDMQDGTGRMSTSSWLGIYTVFIVVCCVFMLFRFFALAKANMNASERLHNKSLLRVLHAPLAFFTTTPVGRIMNRFSEDLFTIDDKINFSLSMFFGTFFLTVTIAIIVCISAPFFLACIIPLVYLYCSTQEWYMIFARELVRLDVTSRSPLYASFGETLSGLDTIRAFKQEDRFKETLAKRLDLQQSVSYAYAVINRWLSVRVESIGALAIFFAFFLNMMERDVVKANIAAMTIGACLQMPNLLVLMAQSTTEFGSQIVSVQRIADFLNLDQEGPLEEDKAKVHPPANWPSAGEVSFRNYTLRYRPSLPPALKSVNFVAPRGAKIGVVGRTGAGKSSLLVAMFRLCEPAGGTIVIDGVDIRDLALSTLRRRLCVIPQDPVLFRGTLRKNLDILDKHTDDELWDALDAVNLKEKIKATEGGLFCEVTEGGSNFSIGERQLFCLARGLLSQAMVMVLDEATANVDLATEEKIHHVIFKKCKNSTIFLIAHRIHTIMQCDRIMMMERGELIESGSPKELLANPASKFSELVKKSGNKDADEGGN